MQSSGLRESCAVVDASRVWLADETGGVTVTNRDRRDVARGCPAGDRAVEIS